MRSDWMKFTELLSLSTSRLFAHHKIRKVGSSMGWMYCVVVEPGGGGRVLEHACGWFGRCRMGLRNRGSSEELECIRDCGVVPQSRGEVV